jgi:hypothetical protein
MDVATLGCPKQISSVQRLHATSDQSTAHHHLVTSDEMFMSWQATSGSPIPHDWLQLQEHGGTEFVACIASIVNTPIVHGLYVACGRRPAAAWCYHTSRLYFILLELLFGDHHAPQITRKGLHQQVRFELVCIAAAGLQYLSAVRVKCGNKRLGILTLGFIDSTEDRSEGSMYVLHPLELTA